MDTRNKNLPIKKQIKRMVLDWEKEHYIALQSNIRVLPENCFIKYEKSVSPKSCIQSTWDYKIFGLRQDIMDFGRKLDEFEKKYLLSNEKNLHLRPKRCNLKHVKYEALEPGQTNLLEGLKDTSKLTPRDYKEPRLCQWMNCKIKFRGNVSILDHLEVHAKALEGSPILCLWQGCKSSGKHFRNFNYLLSHLVQHAGKNPHLCIIRNCNERFPILSSLEKHVSKHFLYKEEPKVVNKSIRATASPYESIKKEEPMMARITEVNESVRKLFTRGIKPLCQRNEILFSNVVLGNRTERSGVTSFLVHWIPENIYCDEWVSELDYVETKIIKISSLDWNQKNVLQSFTNSISRKGN